MSAPDPAPVPIRAAATVVLLRETAARLEVLLTRRSAQLSFMGDVWVFPGGRLDESDVAAATLQRIAARHRDTCGRRLLALTGTSLEPDLALGLHVAGCRETFEECGVLLARHGDGSPCDAPQIARLAQHRSSIAASGAAFLDMLQAEELYLDVDRLVYWSHWITPSHERKRFDTRFFAVEVPPGQDANVDRTETTEHAWVTVDEAFAHAAAGTMKLAPPTLATLPDLREAHAQAGNVSAMLERECAREVPPILPKWFERDGRVIIVLPWDPEYASLPGEGVQPAKNYPPYLAALPSRRELKIRAAKAP
ncbi:MAG TPA: NUDIX domain-containing protein [Steroidobacteraceae bacterium]